ncbi:MAG: hypothetical protein IKE58_08225 [Blautia sp.]|nr:hypothetical protein [Blautia sp.]
MTPKWEAPGSGSRKTSLTAPLLCLAILLAAGFFLLGSDVWSFYTWWLLAAVMGLSAMPVVGLLFGSFDDKGWIFSKAFAIALTGYLEWFLVSIKAIPFTTTSCVALVCVCAALFGTIYLKQSRRGIECLPLGKESLIIWEEVVFLAAFLVWTYLAGFHPAAFGTEKFMDYGFMEAMMRSSTIPARDMWYSQGVINYYYGGQYFAVFLTKLSGTRVALTYNLMRTFVAGFACAMPFSLVRQMMADHLAFASKSKETDSASGICPDPVNPKHMMTEKKNSGRVPALAGLTSGLAVSMAGNMHYVVYALVMPLIQKWRGQEVKSYWFPDATRFIGYNPDRPEDRTIHEFPTYSFVLGDLHAHVVNILFVLLMMGLLYAWYRSEQKKVGQDLIRRAAAAPVDYKRKLANPYLLLAGFLLGLYQLNNFWDFVIYLVVVSGTALFLNMIEYKGRPLRMIGVTLLQAAWLFVLSKLFVVPFIVQFETMVDGVGIAKHHTLWYQLLILWGLPLFLGVLFLIRFLAERLPGLKTRTLPGLMREAEPTDLFVLLIFFCAFGLVLIPELVYVRDIYESSGNARANTMFKLTYQAYILFAIMMGYVIWRFLSAAKKRWVRIPAALGLILLCLTLGYLWKSADSWFFYWKEPQARQGLDATAYMEADFPEDAAGIRWLRANVKGNPLVLEANGDSYNADGDERVSAMTGLPTILGWYVHEWLWRSDPSDLNEKLKDVETIYTSQNNELVLNLLHGYDVSYIFVGARERAKYQDRLNETMLKSYGNIVFQDPSSASYIIQVTA